MLPLSRQHERHKPDQHELQTQSRQGTQTPHYDARRVKSGNDMRAWPVAYDAWEIKWHEWSKESSTYRDGSKADKYQRLVKARNLGNRRISEGTMDTFITQANQCVQPHPNH